MSNAPHVTGGRPNEIRVPRTPTSEGEQITGESGQNELDGVLISMDGASVELDVMLIEAGGRTLASND